MGITRYQLQEEIAEILRGLPHGDGEWAGSLVVTQRLQVIAHKMALNQHSSDDHLHTMAVLGCGHEETMKAWLIHLTDIGWKW